MGLTKIIKAYNMANIDEDRAEINLYGEVVSSHPLDFWTGEKINGNFIALDEFLQDLEEIKDKKEIIVHINSVGGELYAGLAIYNRLKGLDGNIITVNDSLAASAAALIFQAGNTRRVNAGSNLMVHGTASFLYGYYNISELKTSIKDLEAHNKAALNVLAEASGKSVDEIKTLMDKNTWLTGQEAVDMGLADEVVTNNTAIIALSNDQKHIITNGIMFPANAISNIPQGLPILNCNLSQEKPSGDANINSNMKGADEMEINTVEELINSYPSLAKQINDEAVKNGVEQERSRIQAIEAIEGAIADKEIVNSAKYGDAPLTAEQLAFKAMQLQAEMGAIILNRFTDTSREMGEVATNPNGGADEQDNSATEIMEAVNAYKNIKNGGNANV